MFLFAFAGGSDCSKLFSHGGNQGFPTVSLFETTMLVSNVMGCSKVRVQDGLSGVSFATAWCALGGQETAKRRVVVIRIHVGLSGKAACQA